MGCRLVDVLMMCSMNLYLEQELQRRYNVLKLWMAPKKSQFIKDHFATIRAIVENESNCTDASGGLLIELWWWVADWFAILGCWVFS